MARQKEKSKNNRIEAERARITERFSRADGNQLAIVTPLIQNAAFMKVTLEDLQEAINAEGVVDEYKNGANQYGQKQSATLQSFNALIKNYTSVIKTLAQILPPEEKKCTSSYEKIQERIKTAEEIQAEREAEEEHLRKINAEIDLAAEWQKRQREAEAWRNHITEQGLT